MGLGEIFREKVELKKRRGLRIEFLGILICRVSFKKVEELV